MAKIKVGILGSTGMVGQRFVELLQNHPWFEVASVAASQNSAGKAYREAVKGRWVMDGKIPESVANLQVLDVQKDMGKVTKQVSCVFSAVSADKNLVKNMENAYAAKDIPVISNNSAHRWTSDVPMILPEINPEHLSLIETQQKNNGWKKGFVVVKPNCSIQSYVPLITPLRSFQPKKVAVTTLQAVSGAGKTLSSWPQMQDNVIPYIGGEEEKSEKEPMRIWGKVTGGKITLSKSPSISATCIRVPVSDGHLAAVSVSFGKKPSISEIVKSWKSFDPLKGLNLPSSPKPFITVFEEEDRPQTRLDRMAASGMGISAGRLREDSLFDYKFIGLSHNTIRGADGGAVLTAELLKAKGYLE